MSQRTKLDELCARLDDLDQELLRLLERRATVVSELVALRPEGSRFAPLVDGTRLKSLEASVRAPLDPASLRPMFAAIDAACRVHELAPRVACVGPEGGFPFVAAALHFGARAVLVKTDSPERALDEVARGQCDYAVVTYETLHEGLAFKTIQAIAALELRLVGERSITQALGLYSHSVADAALGRIYATSQHHVLAEQRIAARFPKAEVVHVRSVGAAVDAALANEGAAALVPRGASLPSELRPLAESLGDEGETNVRYGIVARRPMARTGSDATALLLAVHDRPGALHDVLQVFKEKSCNLRRIQSRAVPGTTSDGGWEYLFYVEVGGHVTDRPLVAALEGVRQKARTLQVLGSFPLDEPASSSDIPRP